MPKGSPRLSRLGVLAPAALSACMDASVLAVPAAGAIVSTVLKELSKAFMLKRWFHGSMSAKEAEILMMEKGKNGSFLVRESQAHPGQYVLSVRVRGRVTHITIRRQHNKYDVGNGEQFDDLVGLIEHFRSYPMTENSGDVLRLSQPLSGTRLRASCLDKRVQNMQITGGNSENGFCVDGEFQSLKLLEDRQTFSCSEGMRPENAIKNRYNNVLPFDQTRVVLRSMDNAPYADYINANYIHPFRLSDSNLSLESSMDCLNAEQPNGKVYIATQGCLSNTVNDFWKMVWQDDVRIIAMITNEVENGKKKCERYWPILGHEEHYETLIIKTISEKLCKDYVVRELSVCGESCYRTLCHFQFMNWPDHGAPDKTDGVLDYLYEINQRLDQITKSLNAPYQNIICVHCSAGVGRSGTLIALDMLIDKIKSTGFNCDIDVLATVKMLRAQRAGMVQNKTQYRFLYVVLRDFITSHGIKSRHNSR